ncbi:hypothetical protein PN462_03380 [Spirulina sp. CS-785/01]|uniref:hypothetical protein n=1 Tax=Spirulina sp. CS-785/01 TaxID=3021716 RepID=UPI00232FBA2F|nr:hypothetical protein [Spirulina sp. CS-785/01]MDB9312131.1 hypothetical protein [Spirulina sp. CS-785/01]
MPIVQCLGGEIQEVRDWIEELQQEKNWLKHELNASVTYAQNLEIELASKTFELNEIKNSQFWK